MAPTNLMILVDLLQANAKIRKLETSNKRLKDLVESLLVANRSN